MSRFTAINLSGLAPPDIIETLDYEAIVTAMRAEGVTTREVGDDMPGLRADAA